MPRSSMLLLTAAAIAGGCSRDAPLMAPQLDAVDVVVASRATLAASAINPDGDAIDDVIARLMPALGDHGTALRSALLKVNADRSDRMARKDLNDALDLLASTVPAQYHADLDAIRLELGVATK